MKTYITHFIPSLFYGSSSPGDTAGSINYQQFSNLACIQNHLEGLREQITEVYHEEFRPVGVGAEGGLNFAF